MPDDDPLTLALTLEQSVWDAVLRRDRSALERLFAGDYLEVTLTGERVAGSEVASQSPAVDEIDRYEIDSAQVIRLDDDSVLLSYHLTLDGRCRGAAIAPRHRWATSIWSRTGECWHCRFFQQSPFAAD